MNTVKNVATVARLISRAAKTIPIPLTGFFIAKQVPIGQSEGGIILPPDSPDGDKNNSAVSRLRVVSTSEQYAVGLELRESPLRPGDLVMLGPSSPGLRAFDLPADHVVFRIGDVWARWPSGGE